MIDSDEDKVESTRPGKRRRSHVDIDLTLDDEFKTEDDWMVADNVNCVGALWFGRCSLYATSRRC